MVRTSRDFLLASCALGAWLGTIVPAASTDLGPQPHLAEPIPPPNQWQFSFTPYGWATSINGDVTARGHKADVNESFIEIVEKSDSLLAWMSYFEARKGRFSFFTDFVWADLGFPGHFDITRDPLGRFDRATLNVKGNAQLDYQEMIIQSGVSYEIARWQSTPGSFTALDLMGSARYWNQDVDLSLRVTGTLTVDFPELGLRLQRSRRVAVARSGDLEWIDPVVGARIRHQIAPGRDITLIGDVGGFGAGSEFSWQAVATYGFDVHCFGSPLHLVMGYRALAVDFSENGQFGKNALDVVQHGPLVGITFGW
jgi:hypothetical protein